MLYTWLDSTMQMLSIGWLKVRGKDITGLKRTLEKHQLTSRSWRCTPCVSAPNNMIQYLFQHQRMVN
eukprot:scaffold115333_cov29-Attheya_sp.AAC.1